MVDTYMENSENTVFEEGWRGHDTRDRYIR